MKWIDDLAVIRQWKIPRRCISVKWDSNAKYYLQGFSDASQTAYGACAHLQLQMPSGEYKSSLVISKSRVVPLKTISLPRLELLSALLCARLTVYVKRELKLDNMVCYLWTDSTVALAWIQSAPHKWKTGR